MTRFSLVLALVATMALAVVSTAAAQPNQRGLVNVAVVDNTVQIPIGIAANVCGVSVNVLSVSTGGQASCTAKTATPQLAQVVQQQVAAGGSVGGGAQGGSTATTGTSGGTAGSGTSGSSGTSGTSSGYSTNTTESNTTTPR